MNESLLQEILTDQEFLKMIEETLDFFNEVSSDKDKYKGILKDTLLLEQESNVTRIEEKMDDLFKTLDTKFFENNIIPYDGLTKLIFSRGRFDGEQITSFLAYMDDYSNKKYTSDKPETLRVFLKIYRHINLAKIQHDQINAHHREEIVTLKKENAELKKEIDSQFDKINRLRDEIVEVKDNASSITTQFIAILGIFASILIGAFGAIQGFTSLFENADKLGLGKVFIIFSLGSMSILFVLFFLLYGLSKITGKSLASKTDTSNIFLKYPAIVVMVGILIFIMLIGAALLLSNIELKLAWQGLWWCLPVFWALYFGGAIYYESFKSWFYKCVKKECIEK